MRAIVTDKMAEALHDVPTLEISESVKDKFGIKSVKDLSKYPNLRMQLHIFGNYLVWFSDGSGIYVDSFPRGPIEQFLLNLINQEQ